MTQPEAAWSQRPAASPGAESALEMLGLGVDAERTTQFYPSQGPGRPGRPSSPGDVGHPGPAGRDGRPGPARRPRRFRLVVVCAVVVVLVVAVAVLLTRHPGTPASAGGSPSPVGTGSGSGDTPSIDNVQTDSTPISVAEIFPDATVSTSGFTLSRVAQSVDTNCSAAANGTFASALTTAKCERVLRVTFVTPDKRYAVTAGVAALPTLAAAHQAAAAENFGKDAWFTGLNGPAASGAGHVTTTSGYGYQTVLGRYLIFALSTPGEGGSVAAVSGELTTLSHDFTGLASRAILEREK
jgi:hypothetical protein